MFIFAIGFVGFMQKQMNKTRRKLLTCVIAVMQKLKGMEANVHTLDVLKQAENDLATVLEEEQDVYNNLPTSLMLSVKADILNDNLDNLYKAMSSMETIIEFYELNDEVPYRNINKMVKSVISNCTEAIERV